jgi:hypothetical protein
LRPGEFFVDLRRVEGSVVTFGTARKVVDPDAKIKALRVISEHLIAGRWAEVRGPSEKELKATTVLEFSIEEASSKVRSGPPLDDKSDYGLKVWAGVLPLEMKSRPPIPDDNLIEGVTLPEYVQRYDARLAGRTAFVQWPTRPVTQRDNGSELRIKTLSPLLVDFGGSLAAHSSCSRETGRQLRRHIETW